MGTTIGINTMILLATVLYFLFPQLTAGNKLLRMSFWGIQISLLFFLLSLMAMGTVRSIWFFSSPQPAFSEMTLQMTPFTIGFVLSGLGLVVFFGVLIWGLLWNGKSISST